MRIAVHIIAVSVASALGLSHASAAMLLTQDPLTGQKVVVDTNDPTYREDLITGPRDKDPAEIPPRTYLLTEDETGEQIAINPETGHEYRLREIGGSGTFVLEEK